MTVINPKRQHHPSYGVAYLERVGGTRALVGSATGVHSYAIRLLFHRGERSQPLGDGDHWMARGAPLLVVEMSMLQWAELISLAGTGMQVPCTLAVVDGVPQPSPPESDSAMDRVLAESRADLFEGGDPNDGVRETLTALSAAIGNLPKISNAAKVDLQRRVAEARSKLSNKAVVAHVAVERMGRHLSAAVTEARVAAAAGLPREQHELVHGMVGSTSLVLPGQGATEEGATLAGAEILDAGDGAP